MTFVLVANRLLDGSVVYLTQDNTWSEVIDHAKRLESEDEKVKAEAMGEEAVDDCQIIGPECISITEDQSKNIPARRRETIRAIGPTVRPDLARAIS